MNQTHTYSHSKSSSHTIHNFIAQNLPLKFNGMIQWQVHKTRYEVNLDNTCLSFPLTERLYRLIRYQIVSKIQLKNSILESNIKFPIGIGEICKKSEIPIEIPRWIEVYNVKTRVIGLKNWVSWLNDKKDDQGRDSKQDDENAEYQTDDCTAPNGGICLVVVS